MTWWVLPPTAAASRPILLWYKSGPRLRLTLVPTQYSATGHQLRWRCRNRPGISFNGVPAVPTRTTDVSKAGTYFVTAQNRQGCENSDTINVAELPKLTLRANPYWPPAPVQLPTAVFRLRQVSRVRIPTFGTMELALFCPVRPIASQDYPKAITKLVLPIRCGVVKLIRRCGSNHPRII